MTDDDEFGEWGAPIPRAGHTCSTCGRRRDQVEELYIEILTPFGGAVYTCQQCKDAGKGMK